MKTKDSIATLFHIVSICSVILLFWKQGELEKQTKELQKANENRIQSLEIQKKQIKEMQINNYLNNEKLLLDLKDYLVNTRINTKNRETYIERLKTLIIAYRSRYNESQELIEIPSLDLSICNLNQEKEQFQRIDFAESRLPLFVYDSDFSNSLINLDSKDIGINTYLFKECIFNNTSLNDRRYYKIIFYKCDLKDVKFIEKSNIHEILAINCTNTQSLKKKGIAVMTENELIEEVNSLRNRTITMYDELLTSTSNNLIKSNGLVKKDSLVLKDPFGKDFAVYNYTDNSIENSIEKYRVQYSLFNLRKSQLKNLKNFK